MKLENYNEILEYKEKLDLRRGVHLLRRIGFHPSIDQLNQIIGKTPQEALSLIIGSNNELPEPSNSMKNWLNKLEEDPLDNLPLEIRFEIEGRHRSRYNEFINWWLDLMKNENFPYKEKFTLFLSSIWNIEFTYDTLALIPPPLLYRNNQTLRRLRFASYKQIAEEITLDGSMLLYQSLFYSSKRGPNENFMRELLELFTMGIADLETGKANYTEGDIREGSRALTGWRTVAYLGQEGAPANRPFETFFAAQHHDTSGKKLFQYGEILPISNDDNNEDLVKEKEVKGLIDIIFKWRGNSIAKFISDKILRFYLYSNPAASNINIINQLADIMIENDYQLLPVYQKLFTSELFYDDDFIGCQIKSPVEFIIGLERILDYDFDNISNGKTRSYLNSLEQVLYDPPNVSGWKGYRNWINTNTYPLRVKYAIEIINNIPTNKIVDNFSKLGKYQNFDNFLDDFLIYLLPKELPNQRKIEIKSILLGNYLENDWLSKFNSQDEQLGENIRKALLRLVVTPDFQLC